MPEKTALKLGNISAMEDEVHINILVQRGKHVRLALEREDGVLHFFNLDAVVMPDGQRLSDSVWLHDLQTLPDEPAYFVPTPPVNSSTTTLQDLDIPAVNDVDWSSDDEPPIGMDPAPSGSRGGFIAPVTGTQPHEERVARHARLAGKGLSQREIAETTGWSIATVGKDLKEHNASIPRRTRTPGFYKTYLDIPEAVKKAVVQLYDNNATIEDIERETSVSTWFQGIVLWEYGRKAKPKSFRDGHMPQYLQEYLDAKAFNPAEVAAAN